MGIRAAVAALREVGPHSSDEEIVTLTETDMCAVDAIQYLTGCTFGKGNLIHLDHGKNAYTFIRRSDGKAVRVCARPGAFGRSPEQDELSARVGNGSATEEGGAVALRGAARGARRGYPASPRGRALRRRRGGGRRDAADGPRPRLSIVGSPRPAQTMESRVRRLEGRKLCPACFEAALSRQSR